MTARSGGTAAPQELLAGPLTSAGATCVGNPTFADADLAAIADRDGRAAAWMAAFARYGVEAPAQAHGDFAVAVRDDAGRVLLAVDRFATHSLCYRVDGDQIALRQSRGRGRGRIGGDRSAGTVRLFVLSRHPGAAHDLQGHAPAARGPLRTVRQGQRSRSARWWNPVFEEARTESFEQLRDEFRALLQDSVAAQVQGGRVGCFLSGGTDSSTVAGMLGRVTGEPPPTFSIGFDAKGYDEMEYARIAARHFKADHHEYYVTPDDLVRSIPTIAAAYDQPFGNSSVAPAFYCARMAREAGIDRMLAGDGGDELFGGNTRYARQRVFAFYDQCPELLRRSLLEPALLGWPGLARIPGFAKAVSYVQQARVPMPDRLQSYNLLARIGAGEVFDAEFLANVDTDEPLRQQRAAYAACNAGSLVNRMLAFDWKYTLADNDLPKVVGAANLAGVAVGFPLLDDRLVDFSLRLKPSFKLKGGQLRWFFKEALRGFLPDATITKTKHGFGLPFGVWLTTHAGLQELAFESLHSLGARGYVRRKFVDALRTKHLSQHPTYYGEMVWILVMLEQWLRANEARVRDR